MSKRVLILVLSSDFPPYSELMRTSKETWDSVKVQNCETLFYCSKKDNPMYNKQSFVQNGNVLYFDVPNSLYDMNHKNFAMFEWVLKNKEFDYIFRCNASCYVHKLELMKYIESLPEENVFAGLQVMAEPIWIWGGGSFIFSKDVIKKLVENKHLCDHTKMEDMGLSFLATQIGIPFTQGVACSVDKLSIDKLPECWRCMCYGTESFEFSEFSEITKAKGQFGFRIKQDYDRTKDEWIMRQLFKYLN